MERFVRLIVGGGVVGVAGLWAAELIGAWSSPWLLGIALTAIGTAVLLAGMVSELRF